MATFRAPPSTGNSSRCATRAAAIVVAILAISACSGGHSNASVAFFKLFDEGKFAAVRVTYELRGAKPTTPRPTPFTISQNGRQQRWFSDGRTQSFDGSGCGHVEGGPTCDQRKYPELAGDAYGFNLFVEYPDQIRGRPGITAETRGHRRIARREAECFQISLRKDNGYDVCLDRDTGFPLEWRNLLEPNLEWIATAVSPAAS